MEEEERVKSEKSRRGGGRRAEIADTFLFYDFVLKIETQTVGPPINILSN